MDTRQHERGIALILTLFLVSALSVLAASLMFLSQTETYASMNYRMMSQARYAAEGGVQKAADFLLDSTQYSLPGASPDLLSNFDRTVSPVTFGGQPVVLSSIDGVDSNYPISAKVTAFQTATTGTLAAGSGEVHYKASAKLLSMRVFDSYGGGQSVLQTWEITGEGSVPGARTATVEVMATVETPKVSANAYAAFATHNGCGAIYFHGNVTVDSYDSSDPLGYAHSHQEDGGDVGTNGNLQIQGSVEVQGNLYTPRTGVGSCEEGAVTALSETGNAEVTGSVIQLPKAVSWPLPTFTATPPTNTVTINAALLGDATAACSALGLTNGTNCTVNAVTKTVTVNGHGSDVTMPTVSVAGGFKLVLEGNSPANNININALTGSGDVEVSANLVTNTNQSVVLKIAGKNPDNTDMTTPFDLSTMAWKQNSANHAKDASALQIVYGGPAEISMKGGNSQSAATIYAPNASFSLQGTQDLYGSVLAKTITNGGNASIHYDRRLSKDFYVAGSPMVGTFTWKRY